MKTRNFFVSNSSSSSSIIVLPDNFKLETDDEDAKFVFKFLLKNGGIGFDYNNCPDGISVERWANGCSELDNLLSKYVVATVETGADGCSGIDLISNDKIRKIWKETK